MQRIGSKVTVTVQDRVIDEIADLMIQTNQEKSAEIIRQSINIGLAMLRKGYISCPVCGYVQKVHEDEKLGYPQKISCKCRSGRYTFEIKDYRGKVTSFS